ncbi:hypothetical protein [Lentibacillus juripiscarius]
MEIVDEEEVIEINRRIPPGCTSQLLPLFRKQLGDLLYKGLEKMD